MLAILGNVGNNIYRTTNEKIKNIFRQNRQNIKAMVIHSKIHDKQRKNNNYQACYVQLESAKFIFSLNSFSGDWIQS